MRILYIATDNPAVDTILGGMDGSALNGLPAFFFPFQMLLDRGHTVDILLYTPEEKTVVESEHFKAENLIQVHPKARGPAGFLEFPVKLAKAARTQMRSRKYDFVYGMTEGAYPALKEATKMGIPCGQRIFGTRLMTPNLEKHRSLIARWAKGFKEHTYVAFSLLSRKAFLLITNDGCRADELHSLLNIRNPKYAFYFWKSGVDIPKQRRIPDAGDEATYPAAFSPLTLSHIGRIDDMKGQDRSVKIMAELHKRGYPFHLYFIGSNDNPIMYDRIMKAAEQYQVMDYLHFMGGQSQQTCRQYARNSFATMLPGDWNRVNVFYEAMSEGSILVTNNNHSLDEFLEPGDNCILFDDGDEAGAAEQLIALIKAPEEAESMRNAAYQTAVERFYSLEKRFGMEVQLIEDAANGKDLSGYPAII